MTRYLISILAAISTILSSCSNSPPRVENTNPKQVEGMTSFHEQSQIIELTEAENKGVSMSVSGTMIEDILEKRDDFAEKGLLLFQNELGYGTLKGEISLLKSSDPYDMVRHWRTDGINYNITNEDLIVKLKEWVGLRCNS